MRLTWGAMALIVAASVGGSASAQLGGAGEFDKSTTLGAKQVTQQWPGARIGLSGQTRDSIVSVYGKPMNAGPTAADAATSFLADHDDALGVTDPDLTLLRSLEIGAGKFTVFHYAQSIDGIPVEYGQARVLVLNPTNPGDDYRVVYAAGKLLDAPLTGMNTTVTPDEAVARVQNDIAWKFLPLWSEPELVVAYHEATDQSVLAWKFFGYTPGGAGHDGYSFFVDAQSAELVHWRNEVLNAGEPTPGVIEGNATPGTLPDVNYNPSVPMGLGHLNFEAGGFPATTDAAGNFTYDLGDPSSVFITASLSDGQWVEVVDVTGPTIGFSDTVNGLGGIGVLINDAPAQFTTAQVNAYIHTTLTHDYIKDRAPGFTEIDIALPANVNINSDCNASFSPINVEINFFRELGGCVNTAYAPVIAHEYGHFIVFSLGLAQGAFGEGYSDTVAIMMYDTGIMGEDFSGPGTFVRDPENAQTQYPCSGGIHFCGQIIGGTWRWIRLNVGDTIGDELALDLMRQLHVDWTMVTLGGQGSNSAHPGTAIEILTLDDDDGDLTNGTPFYNEICEAFDRHNVPCPPVAPVFFDIVGDAPALLTPNQPTPIAFEVESNLADPFDGTAQLFTSTVGPGGPFTEQSVTSEGGNAYTANLPPVDCGSNLWWYLQVNSTDGIVAAPLGAPENNPFSSLSASALDVIADADFEAPAGWTGGAPGDDATTGIWERVDPVGTSAQPGDDHTADGTICWVTGQHNGGGAGGNDIDGGTTTLLSDTYDLSDGDAVISYWRWYSNSAGNAPNADTFTIEVTNNGGFNWQTVEVVGPGGPETDGGWIYHEFNVADIVAPSDSVRLRFVASDLGDGSLVEAAIDDFRIERVVCDPIGPDVCDADLDMDGFVNSGDLNVLLSGFGSSAPGDIDGDGSVNSTDLNILLGFFGEECD